MNLEKITSNFHLLQILLFLVLIGSIWGNFKIIEIKKIADTNAYVLDKHLTAADTFQASRAGLTKRGKGAIRNIDLILQNQVRINFILENQIIPLQARIKKLEKKVTELEKKLN